MIDVLMSPPSSASRKVCPYCNIPSITITIINSLPVPENKEETAKRKQIEAVLSSKDKRSANYDVWKAFALSDYGLVNDDLRRQIWPLLVNVDPDEVEPVPSIDSLKSHVEYNQVILDVNRSIKRFPPGIPYEQRIALQDQLTVLIMRVITKYPHLRYYQVSLFHSTKVVIQGCFAFYVI